MGCVCVKQQVGQLWLTHVTRCSDSRGIAKEEVELDGGGKRRRDGWRFDRFEVSGEEEERGNGWVGGGGVVDSNAWITWSEHVWDGIWRIVVQFYSHWQSLIHLRWQTDKRHISNQIQLKEFLMRNCRQLLHQFATYFVKRLWCSLWWSNKAKLCHWEMEDVTKRLN